MKFHKKPHSIWHSIYLLAFTAYLLWIGHYITPKLETLPDMVRFIIDGEVSVAEFWEYLLSFASWSAAYAFCRLAFNDIKKPLIVNTRNRICF